MSEEYRDCPMITLPSGEKSPLPLVSVVYSQLTSFLEARESFTHTALTELARICWKPGDGLYLYSGLAHFLCKYPDIVDSWFESDGMPKQSIAAILKACINVGPSPLSPSITLNNPFAPLSKMEQVYGRMPIQNPFADRILSPEKLKEYARVPNLLAFIEHHPDVARAINDYRSRPKGR